MDAANSTRLVLGCIESVQWHAGFTLLHWAAKHGSVEWCEYFLALGADPTLRDDRGKTPAESSAGFDS